MHRTNLKASRFVILLCRGVIWIFFSVLAHAQATASISGTVTDSTGGVIPGATVRATSEETGISREVQTGARGSYRISELGLGLYSIEAQVAGFQTEVRRGIRLTVGGQAVVDMQLRVGAVSERVEVTAEAPLVQTKDSAISYLVDEDTMRDLPLNGRSYTQLAILQPNVMPNNNYSKNVTSGTGLNLVVQGQRPGANLFLMDGTEANDYVGKTPGGVAGVTLGVEAIREFNLLTGNYSAEFGHFLGGVVNVATRSGTNDFHGNVFAFHRNSVLDAKNFFDKLEDPIPPFKRNNFGGTFGGPIVKERAFFFANYEALRERKSNTVIVRVPNEAAHRGNLPSGPVTVNPAILPLLNAWPLPNGRDYGDGTGELIGNPLSSSGDDYIMFRTDFHLSDSHSLFGRYTIDDSYMDVPESPPTFLSHNKGRLQFLTLSETAIVNPTTLNVLSLGFNRTGGSLTSSDIVSFPTGYSFMKEVDKLGSWTIRSPSMQQGVGTSGTRREHPRYWFLTVYEISDKVSRQQGAHSLTMGGTFKQYDFVGFSATNALLGTPTFDTLADFLRAKPLSFVGAPNRRDPQRSFRQHLVGVFIQDDVRVTSNLTLNLGLRYEFVTSPAERNGKMTRLDNPESDKDLHHLTDNIYETTKKNFSPRFGFAWDPFSQGKTSIRGGASIFYNILTVNALELGRPMATNCCAFQLETLQTGNIGFPRPFDVPGAVGKASYDSYLFNDVAKSPTRYFWTLGFQHEVANNTLVSANYSGSRAAHLFMQGERNTAIPILDANGDQNFVYLGVTRRNPYWNSLVWREYGGNSYYHGMAINVVRRFAEGFQGQMSYTWSKNIDDSSTTFSGAEASNDSGSVQDFYNRAAAKGLSTFDIRHNFVSTVNWSLPLGTHSGAAAKLLDGWQLSGILVRSTGVPYTAKVGYPQSISRPPVSSGGTDYPNLVAGKSNNPVLGGPDKYFDANNFVLPLRGHLGNVGRNTIIGPGVVNLDFSVKKNTNITEATSLEFRAEFFNILNHPNFGSVHTNLFRSGGVRDSAAGRINDTKSDSRQIQFGLKLNF